MAVFRRSFAFYRARPKPRVDPVVLIAFYGDGRQNTISYSKRPKRARGNIRPIAVGNGVRRNSGHSFESIRFEIRDKPTLKRDERIRT